MLSACFALIIAAGIIVMAIMGMREGLSLRNVSTGLLLLFLISLLLLLIMRRNLRRLEKDNRQLITTIHRKTDEVLKKSTAHYQTLVDNIDGIVWEADALTFRFSYVSKAAERFLGYPVQQWIDESNFWRDHIHPEDRESTVAFCVKSTREKKPHQFEYRMIAADGSVVWLHDRVSVIVDKNEPFLLRGVMTDITERKTEREKMITAIIQRNKNLEQFSYIVSHNLRAPVANIIGLVAAFERENTGNGTKKEIIKGLALSAKKLDEVIMDLNKVLQVKFQVSENKEPVHFSQLVADIRSGICSLIKKDDITINSDFTEIDEMLTFKSYLYSIFYNLISNSIRFNRKEVPVVIDIRSRLHNDTTVLYFKDNGTGIDLANRGDQVFGLYKRFHTGIEGKGMGLFMVKTQVEALGGNISISSEVNKGTMFTIELPN